MNAVVMPIYCCRTLATKAIPTIMEQDVPITLLVINNGSQDGSLQAVEALRSKYRNIFIKTFVSPVPLSRTWNCGIDWAFENGAREVLVLNDDVELRADFYRVLRSDPHGLVTGVGVDSRSWQTARTAPLNLTFNTHPTFSAYMLKKWAWEKVGRFDENYLMGYCEDGDWHLRAHRAGVKCICLNIPFLHHGSASGNSMSEDERKVLMEQADRNRDYFEQKWGFRMASKDYYDAFSHGPPPDKGYE